MELIRDILFCAGMFIGLVSLVLIAATSVGSKRMLMFSYGISIGVGLIIMSLAIIGGILIMLFLILFIYFMNRKVRRYE